MRAIKIGINAVAVFGRYSADYQSPAKISELNLPRFWLQDNE